MVTLVIETATTACSVALIDGDRVTASAHEVVGRGHAERLVPMVAALLAGRDTPEAVRVDCGPGSFTGVRVGLAAARAFAFGWRCPLHGFSSLALIAAMADPDEPITIAMAGGHGELFVQRFSGRPLAALGALRSMRPEDAAAIADARIAGPGGATLQAARGGGDILDILPDAAAAWRLPDDLAMLAPTPIYGRAPDAKIPL